MSMTDETPKAKKKRHSRTLWLAVGTAVAGAVLTSAPDAMPAAATGPGLIFIAALNAALRVLTTQPVR
jgi:drug/metabolite transporter (DMT)-like permease